ncbi:MAG: S41 family peptidase [bacterium]
MKFLKRILFIVLPLFVLISCFEDRDDNGAFASEINDFVWKGMNAVYLYKDFVPDLANDRFSSDQEYADYLNNSGSPEELFESLIYNRQTVDKFSWIVDDYIALEQQFDGITRNNGMEFGLRLKPGSNSDVYGYVRLVLPNSDAESKGIERGDVFDTVDGVALNVDNFSDLLSSDDYTITLANYNDNGTIDDNSDDTVTSGTETISLSKLQYTENPVYLSEIFFDVGGETVGYLMYNGFTADFDTVLNNTFGNFALANVQHLVLDLRYNPGGSVNTAILLSSMITGQFTGEVFITEEWNSDLQEAFSNQDPESLINRFKDNDDGTALNSLNLDRVYILTTGSSASASELVINGLNPYIDVVQIGTTTTGKYQASVTIYDSDNFGRSGANPNHTYAMQPLIFKSLNSVGFTDYDNGLPPDIEQSENIANLGVLGDEDEPLLATALAEIAGSRSALPFFDNQPLIGDSKDFVPHAKEMYKEGLEATIQRQN